MKVGLTGSSGFVGTAMAQRLQALEAEIVTIGHQDRPGVHTTYAQLTNAQAPSPWLLHCDALVHLGARVHVMQEDSQHPLELYREVNVRSTISLAHAAVSAGVKRFVFVSSIKVLGESTDPGHAFLHDDVPRPDDPYGISKREAEDALRDVAARTGLEVVIVRPPLVYGPGVKANFANLMRWVQRGRPLPLGAVTRNRRSLVALDNLVDLLVTCIQHPAAANQTFLVSDGEDLSTSDLLRRMGRALDKPANLWPVPPSWLRAGATVMGKGNVAQRLLDSLQVDIAHTRTMLDWTPPVGVDEGLRRAAIGMVAGS